MKLEEAIEHTLLKPDATENQIKQLCREAKDMSFAFVCVNSCYASLAARELSGSKTGVSVVAGFPLGAMSSASKAYEAACAVKDGAGEIDMVMNVGFAKSGQWELVREDIRAVVKASGVPVKVILETCLLTDDEKKLACLAAKEADAQFVKTSTGFGTGGATVHDVALLRQSVGNSIGVKASGGIKTLSDATSMLEAGATRLGTSAGVYLIRQTR